jgi:hypothetical protein
MSAPVTWEGLWTNVANSAAQQALGNGTLAVATPGTRLFAVPLSQEEVIPPNILDDDFLSSLGVSIANVSDELVLCGTPITSTVPVHGIITFKEY